MEKITNFLYLGIRIEHCFGSIANRAYQNHEKFQV